MTEQNTSLISLKDTMDLGAVMVRSGFFADSKDQAQAVVKILAGRELGFGPIASMTGIYIVKGRVTLGANLIGAAIKRNPRYDYRVTRIDNAGCEIEFYQDGKQIGTSTFVDKDAQTANLNNKDNWRQFPRNMMFSRAISNGARWYCPDVFGGPIYTPDELGAAVDGDTGEMIDAQSWSVVREPETATANESVPANGNGNAPIIEINPDLEALTWAELADAAIAELGYSHRKHVTATCKQELGDVWANNTRTQVWAALAEHQAAKREEPQA